MPIDTKPAFPDQTALMTTLYRLEGLADAIFAVAETGATEAIAEGALFGVQSALKRDLAELREAASGEEIIIAAPATGSGAPALAALIERHQTAIAVLDADTNPEAPLDLIAAKDAALHEIASLPVDDATLLVKLHHMMTDQKRRYGPMWNSSDADEIMAALELHFTGEMTI